MKKQPLPSPVVGMVILPNQTPRVAHPIRTPPRPKNVSQVFWRSVQEKINAMLAQNKLRDMFIDSKRMIGANISRIKRKTVEIAIYWYERIKGVLKSFTKKYTIALEFA